MARPAYDRMAVYFQSGTGNTMRAASWMAEQAEEAGVPAELTPMDAADPASDLVLGPRTLLGLAVPTHGFTAPWLTLKVACRLPRGRGTHAFCLATRGSGPVFGVICPGLAASACWVLAAILAVKGYRVRGIRGLNMPSNWIQVHPGLGTESIAAVLADSKPLARAFAARLLSGRRYWLFYGNWVDLAFGLALLPLSAVYLVYGRVGFGKVFFAGDACEGCGVCVDYCPVGGVQLRGDARPRPYWTYHCESCNRCIAYCPKEAIHVGHAWLLGLCALSFVPVWDWAMDALLDAWPALAAIDGAAARFALLCLYWWAALIVSGMVLWLFVRIPVVNRVFTWTAPTRVWRRHRDPETKLKMLGRRRGTRHPVSSEPGGEPGRGG